MKKQLLMVIASAALSTACSGTRDTGSTSTGSSGSHSSSTGTHSSSTGGGSTGSSAGTGSTGGSTGGACLTVAQAKVAPASSVICMDDATTIIAGAAGDATSSGTKFAGNYFVADSSGAAVLVYKSKPATPTGDPVRGDVIKVTGTASQYQGQQQIISTLATPLSITIKSSGNALPAPFVPASAADIADTNAASDTNLGKYVQVPAGTYTADYAPAEFLFASADGGAAKYDGFKLTSGSDTILVETYSFRFNTGSCFDGGRPTFGPENGGFKGVFDKEQIQDGQKHKIVVFGSCDDSH